MHGVCLYLCTICVRTIAHLQPNVPVPDCYVAVSASLIWDGLETISLVGGGVNSRKGAALWPCAYGLFALVDLV